MSGIRVISFKTEYKGDKAIIWVELAPSGENFDKVRTWHQVSKLIPPADWDETKKASDSYIAMADRWNVVGPAYQAYVAGTEVPEHGTPLAAWSGVTAEQAAILRGMGIRTVEEVRDMGEGPLGRLPFPGARQMPKLAGDYLSGASAAEKDAELATMRERMAAMEEMLADRMGEAQKRGPGRPRKDEAA
ncbi:MAG: hypothetical protein RL268_479 [Pseudomonadota bacterium]|jgi:hypothetical protein